MLEEKGRRRSLKGNIMAYRLKPGFIFNSNTNFGQLDINCYSELIPGPVPLAEIDFPTDIINMFKYGSPLIPVEGKQEDAYTTEVLWNHIDTTNTSPGFWNSGDMILINYADNCDNQGAQALTLVKFLIQDTQINRKAVNHRKPVYLRDIGMIMFDMGQLPQFQPRGF